MACEGVNGEGSVSCASLKTQQSHLNENPKILQCPEIAWNEEKPPPGISKYFPETLGGLPKAKQA